MPPEIRVEFIGGPSDGHVERVYAYPHVSVLVDASGYAYIRSRARPRRAVFSGRKVEAVRKDDP